ncbi:recombinase family protein [Nonomuraea glycinis]|uniref:recombinase family protein n=1 Tax=Nonomuraea glycinis TaxID=2047744 RepID=UPI001E4DE1D6|nr:recombinase family protein [Nonomuraea glycinis]
MSSDDLPLRGAGQRTFATVSCGQGHCSATPAVVAAGGDERKAAALALIGLVRVSTDKQETQRQHDALDPICLKVFEEKTSGKLATDDRPALLDALSYIRDGDILTVHEVDRLGRNLLEGLIVLQRPVPARRRRQSAGGHRGRRAHRTLPHPGPGPRPVRRQAPRHRPQDQERPGGRPGRLDSRGARLHG